MRVDSFPHRKWREIQQQTGTAGPGNILSCCLVSLSFLCDIHSILSVESSPQYSCQGWGFFCRLHIWSSCTSGSGFDQLVGRPSRRTFCHFCSYSKRSYRRPISIAERRRRRRSQENKSFATIVCNALRLYWGAIDEGEEEEGKGKKRTCSLTNCTGLSKRRVVGWD